MENWIEEIIDNKIELINKLKTDGYFDEVTKVSYMIVDAIKQGNKVICAGNGGSACDASHLAGELVGSFMMDRNPMPALSLGVDSSVVTSISNDYGYSDVFSRQLDGLGKNGDVFIGISTSGNSDNIIRAVEIAKKKGITTVGFLGKDGGKLKDLCDYPLVVASDCVPRIQEIHTLTVHLICELVEKEISCHEK